MFGHCPSSEKLFQLRSAICKIEGGPGLASSRTAHQSVVASTGSARDEGSLADAAGSRGPNSAFTRLFRVDDLAGTGLLNGPSDLFGVRSLLDLLFLVVFESPGVLQMEAT